MIKRHLIILACLFTLLPYGVWAVVPKIEGRYIELQNTYTSPIWTQINFQQQYITPPAVFMLSTNQGGNPAIVKIRNVTTTGFEALPLEPSGEDGAHITMGAHYLAVEYGLHEFPDGTVMEVGQTTLQNELQYGAKSGFFPLPKSYKSLTFNGRFTVRPNFFHSLQTMNSVDSNPPSEALIPFLTVAVESSSLTQTGVNIALEASETAFGVIKQETVAYLVVEPGKDRSFIDDNGVEVIWESFFTGFNIDGWNDGCNLFYFENDYDVAPLVVASKNSRLGDDGGWLRSCNLRTNRLGLVVDEDRDGDNERNHLTKEEASILAMTSTFVSNGDILSCETLFPGAIATYNDGTIQLVDGVVITDDNGPLLTTTNLINTALTNPAQCNGFDCLKSGDDALEPSQASQVPTVANDGSSSGAVATSLAGDYFFDQLTLNMLASNYTVTAPTRIFLENTDFLLDLAALNIGSTNITVADGAYLAIYVDGDVNIAAGATIPAFIVATGEVRVAQGVSYSGSITAGGQIITEGSSSFTATTVPEVIPGFCGIYTPVTLDHYRLSMSDNTGLTCQAKVMTLTACANDACDILFDETSSIDLSPDDSGQQSWVTSEIITFTGSTEVEFAKRTTGSVTFGYNVADPSAPLRCYIGGNNVGLNGCKVSFSDAGFIFKNDTHNNTTIPTQLSGKPSDTGFNAIELALQAVKTNTTTGSCEAAFPIASDVDIELSYQCGNTSSCSDAVALSNNGNTYDVTQTAQTFALRFDADSKASLVLNYPDAGQLSLTASTAIVLDPVANLQKVLTGSSNEYVVKPFGLALAVDSEGYATDASGSLFRLTGEEFAVKMNAVQWLNGQDSDANGYPDDLTAIGNNPIAKHFIGDAPLLDAELVLPAGGVQGTLSAVNTASFSTSNSESISDYQYDNVGIINLKAGLQDADYLGAGDVLGQLNNVGRFAPSQYRLIDSQANAMCTRYGSHLTYLGQPFELGFTVQALNHQDQVMSNYQQGFAKSQVQINAENSDANNYVAAATLASRLVHSNSSSWSSINGGEYIFADSNSQLTRRSDDQPDGPFEMVNLMVSLSDIEGASVLGANDLANSSATCTTNCDSVRLNAVPISFRYGRLVLGNNAGSDLDNLHVPMQAQYWNGTAFVRNSEDNCSVFNHDKLTQVAPATPVLSFIYSGTGAAELEAGSYPINNAIYAQPNGAGEFTLQYATESWLQWDWLGDNSRRDPQSVLQFGRFRGNDRVIYWRETR